MHPAGRLLGHRRASSINRRDHQGGVTLSEAAERMVMAIEHLICANRQSGEINGTSSLARPRIR